MMIATASVHATGINWVGISPILGVIIAAMAVLITMQQRKETRQQTQNDQIKMQISTSIDNLSEVLQAKLETKEKVSQISERLARLEGASHDAIRN